MRFEDFVPTREGAIAAGVDLRRSSWNPLKGSLLEDAGVVEHDLAAAVITASTVELRTWESEASISERRFAEIAGQDPTSDAEIVVGAVLDEGGPTRCSTCGPFGIGRVPCVTCGGDGKLATLVLCGDCTEGVTTCGDCEGTGRVRRVRLRHARELASSTRDVVAPDLPVPDELEAALVDVLRTLHLPEALKVTGGAETAYRGGQGRQADQRGRLGALRSRFEERVEHRMARPGMLQSRVDGYVWPFLWLHWERLGGRDDALLLVRADGSYLALFTPD